MELAATPRGSGGDCSFLPGACSYSHTWHMKDPPVCLGVSTSVCGHLRIVTEECTVCLRVCVCVCVCVCVLYLNVSWVSMQMCLCVC
jgi:hypothetical protein